MIAGVRPTVGPADADAQVHHRFAVSDEGPFVPDGWSGNWQTMITVRAVAVSADLSAPTGEPPVYLLAPGPADGPALYWGGLTDRSGRLTSRG